MIALRDCSKDDLYSEIEDGISSLEGMDALLLFECFYHTISRKYLASQCRIQVMYVIVSVLVDK